MSLVKKLLVSTSSNLLLVTVKAIATFLITPIILRSLGRHDYGIWEMVMAVIGYMGLLDIGMMPAIARYAARFNAQRDNEQFRTLYSTVLLFLGIVGGVCLIFFCLWALLRPDLLATDGTTQTRYVIFLIIIGLQLLITFPGQAAESVLNGLQLYWIKNRITIFNSITGTIVTYFFIERFDGLLFLALSNGIGVTVKYIIFFRLVRKSTHGTLRVTTQYRSMTFFKELSQFGFKSFVQGIATSLHDYAPTLIIGMVIGPAYVVFYALPLALVRQVQSISWTLMAAFLPMFSELHAKGETEYTKKIFLIASRLTFGLILPVALLVALLGSDFLNRWAGKEFSHDAAILLVWMAIANLLMFINPFASHYLTAIARHGMLAKISMVSAISNVGLSLALAYLIGVQGPPMAGALVASLIVPYILRHTCRQLGISTWTYVNEVLLRYLVAALTLITSVLIAKHFVAPTTYPKIIAIAGITGILYVMVALFTVLTTSERRDLLDWCRRMLLQRKRYSSEESNPHPPTET